MCWNICFLHGVMEITSFHFREKNNVHKWIVRDYIIFRCFTLWLFVDECWTIIELRISTLQLEFIVSWILICLRIVCVIFRYRCPLLFVVTRGPEKYDIVLTMIQLLNLWLLLYFLNLLIEILMEGFMDAFAYQK